MPANTEISLAEFDQLCKERGWTTLRQRADGLGLDVSTISRVQTGENKPGASFIHACLAVFGADAYPRLFPSEEAA